MTKISFKRMGALMVHELYLTKHSLETFFDIFFFPLMNVVLFGFIATYLAGANAGHAAQYAMLGVLLWEVVTITQYSITVSTMWSVWSHNLTNLFVTPVSTLEYMGAHLIASFVKTAAITWTFSLAAYWLFHFNLLQVGVVNLIMFYLNLTLFAWWVGMILLGFIFRFGTRIQAIAWGLIFFFQPLTAAFFPLSTLPQVMQVVAKIFPATYVFEAARSAVVTPGIYWQANLVAGAMNILYFIASCLAFGWLFRRSRQNGKFAHIDTQG